MEPIFADGLRSYTYEDFMADSDVEFSKLKSFFDKNPKILKEDPLVGLDYLQILQMIRKTYVVEQTSN